MNPSPPRKPCPPSAIHRCDICDGYIWLGRCADKACLGWETWGLSAASWARRQNAFSAEGSKQ